ncbi:MAG: DNA primase [Aeromicrobium sp.]|nr:MAG: DNA primase [Aeromicrobium sp.]
MALIKDEDIQLVRERVRIDEIVEQYVTLKNAGGGARKGLCPFHDEKSPSFTVRPAQGFYHCFGCGVGGDSITFLREIEGLSFAEAVERLAAKTGVNLRYEEDDSTRPKRDAGQRQRLLDAHREAAEFYAHQLGTSPEAAVGRQFVQDRGFDQTAAERFGMGWAPRGGEALVAHLRTKGFNDEDLVVGGLAARGSRGLYDKFRGRLLWPIREISGEVVGFGARRMFDDDRVEAKYLNTAETPIYKKSQVLYGLDLARRSISSQSQAVIVEGYTDVMACHQAGITTAVATCGTAFGEGHTRILRRLMLDNDAFRGEVVFTFDGDEAGRRAAMKAFTGDQQFVAQTYVAVEPRGMDPCDLRLADGDAAVRDLIASRVPLYRFVLKNTLAKFDLDRGDQRVDAVREAVALASSIRDRAKVEEFLREISSLVGVDVDHVRAELQRSNAQGKAGSGAVNRRGPAQPVQPDTQSAPQENITAGFGAPGLSDEREALKVIIQYPHLAAPWLTDVADNDFTHAASKAIWATASGLGIPSAPDSSWVARLSDAVGDSGLQQVVGVAAVEPIRAGTANMSNVVGAVICRLQELTVMRRIVDVKSRLQRTNPIDSADEYNKIFGELVALEAQRRGFHERIIEFES